MSANALSSTQSHSHSALASAGASAFSSTGRPYSPGSLEVLNSLRNPTTAPLEGYTDIRVRDAGQYAERANSAPTLEDDKLIMWPNMRQNRMRPVIFQPNGSFKALKETGRLPPGEGELLSDKVRGRNPLSDTAYHLPGYTGYVRGSQHLAGRSFGESTRRALSTDYRELVCSSPVPSDPEGNRKIRQIKLEHTYVSTAFGDRQYHIPGYTGFVPGVRFGHAQTYGALTHLEMEKNTMKHSRQSYGQIRNGETEGFARTSFPRQIHALESAPLPGGAKNNLPPVMYIPASVKYLKYIPM